MGCLLKQGGGLYARLRVGAVLLAAGEGARMGGVAKPLIRLQGVPLINRQLIALSGAGVDEVVVVTGHAREAIEAQVQAFPVTLAHNPAYREGQQGSVRVGLAALSGHFDAVFVVLADQPLIGSGDLTELISAFKKRPTGNVVVPVVGGQRGNPIVLDDVARSQILASDTNLGCRHLIERQPELVHVHETSNTRFITDLDTLQDVEQLAQRTGWRLELPDASTDEGAA
ncbi:MAG: nucleotidyltransferase family protein [Polaromonas sp.]|uniref:nucleotidyltransferase family protein n=1 Tax=Polaromonas sp. TaxID=1869339 RepID=UPI002730BBAE|nr:nucleotidyltransferase family protein [Polaromonas sp.]MDP2256979.1 nucleotidyltransferase family protein [Polaromonas sp.]